MLIADAGSQRMKPLAALLLGALVVGLAALTSPSIAFDTRALIEARLTHDKKKSFQAFTEGLNEAAISLRDHPGEVARAREAARHGAAVFYSPAETRMLELWSQDGILVLYTRLASGNFLWLARNDKRLLTERDQLPEAARALLTSSASP